MQVRDDLGLVDDDMKTGDDATGWADETKAIRLLEFEQHEASGSFERHHTGPF